jgi:hypothetical protein
VAAATQHLREPSENRFTRPYELSCHVRIACYGVPKGLYRVSTLEQVLS